MSEAKFTIGDCVQKYTGAYTAFGEVRAVYTTKRGDTRYVVEVEPQGFQMIWSAKELRAVKPVQAPPALEVPEGVRSVPISHLDFPARIRHVMGHCEVDTVGKLLDYDPRDLMRWPNFGKLSMMIVRAELAKLGVVGWERT